MSNPVDQSPLLTYVLRQGDRSLVLAQRLLENVAHAPELEEDMALGNIALDLIGQARLLYTYAGEIEGAGHDENHYAYWRDDTDFTNPLLVEQPNGDFAHLITRQFLYDAFAAPFWAELAASSDESLAAIAAKAVKETAYHLRHSRGWMIRLGDGTDESHRRMQTAVDALWRFTDELFEQDAVEDQMVAAGVAPDMDALHAQWKATVDSVLSEATLTHPEDVSMRNGGRGGVHDEPFSFLIGEMQVVARAHPGASW
jgi:ring-1,2-phenylacetyl-CoA epoxidase subunit PaaC